MLQNLLDELKANGKLLSGTKWKEIYPLIASDQRYLKLLGLPGSTPLELFWDAVDALDLALEDKVKDVEKYMNSKGFKFSEQTSMEELDAILKEDEAIKERVGSDGPGLYRHVSAPTMAVVLLTGVIVPRASCTPEEEDGKTNEEDAR